MGSATLATGHLLPSFPALLLPVPRPEAPLFTWALRSGLLTTRACPQLGQVLATVPALQWPGFTVQPILVRVS